MISCEMKNRDTLGEEYAKDELKIALSDSTNQIVINDNLISDKETAIKISEAILFKIYGEENITEQRPYEIHFINNFWILNGTLKYEKGGTFLIIIDAKNGKVVRLTHGK